MRRLIICILSLVVVLTACSNGRSTRNVDNSPGSDVSNKLNNLIQQLDDEDSKLSGKTAATDISSINESCHKILRSIIGEHESVVSAPEKIVDSNSNMYLKVTRAVSVGSTKARIIEYGKKKADEGSFVKVYIQQFDDKNINVLEALTAVTNSNQIARILTADIYEFSGVFYTIIGNDWFDTDKSRSYLNLTVLQHTNNKWEPVNIGGPKEWSTLELGHSFTVERDDSGIGTFPGIKLLVKDEKGNIVNHRYLDFSEGKPILELYDRNLPAVGQDKQNKINPIVGSYIIGGYSSGQWLDIDDTFKQLSGDEAYKIYSMTECLGEGKGLSKQDVVEKVQGAQPDVTISFGTGTFNSKSSYAPGTNYSQNFSNQIAIGANWNALPRVPKVQSNDINTYKTVVADIISKRGFSSDKVNIKQVLRVDLEGDGVEEVVITASNTAIPLSSETNDNTYSIVVLRKIIDSKVETIVLSEEYYINGKSSLGYDASALFVPFILDANGDGTMEVFVEGIYSPGNFMDVYEVNGRDVTKVLSNGISA